jgi:myo-inositol-1(or 4)-monophosphatase
MRELDVAITAARRAAAAIREVYDRPDVVVTLKDGGKGPLTDADLASDRVLHEVLQAAFPDDAILSEETKDDGRRLGARRVWIIDPLDGTREFTLRVPEFVVSVGLVVDGAPTVGVLVNPVTGDLFTGVVGQGAAKNGVATTVSSTPTLDGARFLVSRSEYEKGWFDAMKGRAAMDPMGSVAYKLGLVASGEVDGTFTPVPRNEWDLAGGVACVLAAGGRATNRHGAPYVFNRPDPLVDGVFVTNGHVHDAVLALAGGAAGR